MNREAETAAGALHCHGRTVFRRWALAAGGLIGGVPLAPTVRAADPVAVIAQSVTGRFEVAAIDPAVGHAVGAQAEEGWRLLAGPLGFPDQFVSPVFIRVVSGSVAVPFQVSVETGGIVSVALRAETLTTEVARRAIVQGILMRMAVSQQGVTERLRVPRWLEEAGVGWWRTRADGAQQDAVRYESRRILPPALSDLLHWQRGPSESPGFSVASLWLMTFLQNESRRTGEWSAFTRALLAGDDPEVALVANYPGRFANEEERELWWQTGWYHVSRAPTLPALEAAESRVQLEALSRFVFADPTGNADAVQPLGEVARRAGEPVVAAEFSRRAAELGRLIPVLHPFYRNAGLSLVEVFRAPVAKSERRAELAAAFAQDWRDATELEAETTAALDALEAKRTRR